MAQSSAALPQQLPDSFFSDAKDSAAALPARTTITSDLHKQNRPNSFVPTKAMMWHDSIIDDLIANPGTTMKATAQRLGRSPVTIGYIVNSDLFKARYAQRRDQFNEELDTRLIGKLAKVAELTLDLTLESLEKKRTAVPLPLLHDITDKALNRLGYGVTKTGGAAVEVTVNTQNNNGSNVATPVSAEALEAARATLRTVEQAKLNPPEGRARQEPLTIEHSSARESAAEGGDGSGGPLGAL